MTVCPVVIVTRCLVGWRMVSVASQCVVIVIRLLPTSLPVITVGSLWRLATCQTAVSSLFVYIGWFPWILAILSNANLNGTHSKGSVQCSTVVTH